MTCKTALMTATGYFVMALSPSPKMQIFFIILKWSTKDTSIHEINVF